jgi:phosphopantetheine--protein transferase-like protein
MGLIAGILAPGIFGAELEDIGQPVPLHPQEELLVAQAGQKRRRDFALGRSCARAALSALGHGDAMVIGRDESGAPLWPTGVVGSITHTKFYAAAMVAQAQDVSGLGVDAEQVGGVTPDLWPRLFDSAECDQLTALHPRQQQIFATLFFSAKEAVYKASGSKSGLAFREIHITPEDGGFTAARSGAILRGRYALQDDLMLTAVWF